MKKIIFFLALIFMASVSYTNAQNLVQHNQEVTLGKAEVLQDHNVSRADYVLKYYATGATIAGLGNANFGVGTFYSHGCINFTSQQMYNYAGGVLDQISFRFPSAAQNLSLNPSSGKVWIKNSLSGAILYEQSCTVTPGEWSHVVLTTPYTLTTSALVIGFSVSHTTTSGAANEIRPIPLTTTGDSYKTGGANYIIGATVPNTNGVGATWNVFTTAGNIVIEGYVSGAPILPTNDLAASTLSAPALKWVGNPATYTVTVWNTGTASQNNYTVQLIDAANTVLGSTTVTTALASGAFANVDVLVTPAAAGSSVVRGKVVLAGDAVSANDISDPLTQKVYSLQPMAYCNHSAIGGVAYGANLPHQAAIAYTPTTIAPFVGKNLTAVEIAFGVPASTITTATVWIRSSLTGANLYEQTFTPVDGWSTVVLNTPYPITSANTFIGWSGQSTNNFIIGSTANTPVVAAGGHIQGDAYAWSNYNLQQNMPYNNAIIGVVNNPPSCDPVTNLTVNYTDDCKAQLTWTPPGGGNKGYAYRLPFPPPGAGSIVGFDVTNANATIGTPITTFPGGAVFPVAGMEWANGFLWTTEMMYLNKIDPSTTPPTLDQIFSMTMSANMLHLSYDYSTSTMYGVQAGATSGLRTINLTDGAIGVVGNLTGLDGSLLSIAISLQGQMYALTSTGDFYTVNKATGACTLVGNTGMDPAPNVRQDMNFDRNTGVLYWCYSHQSGTDVNHTKWATINPATGVATVLNEITGCRYDRMVIPYPQEGDFTYKVYRNNTLIATVSTPFYTDASFSATAGHTWKVTVVCGAQESDAVQVTKPACDPGAPGECDPPTDLLVKYNASCNTATLSWTAPAGKGKGTNTSVLPTTPDRVVFDNQYIEAKKATLQNREPRTITKPVTHAMPNSKNVIFYENFSGSSGTTNPATLPSTWTIVNYGDTDDWGAWYEPDYAVDDDYVMSHDDYWGDRDVWAFSPGFELTAGVTYDISFYLNMPGYGAGDYDAMEVKIGQAKTAAGMTHLVFQKLYSPTGYWDFIEQTFTPTTTGTYYLGFHAMTEAWGGDYIDVDAISVTGAGAPPAIVKYNVYRDGTQVATEITATNFTASFNNAAPVTWTVKVACEEGGESSALSVTKEICEPNACPPVDNLAVTYTSTGLGTCNALISWDKPEMKRENKLVDINDPRYDFVPEYTYGEKEEGTMNSYARINPNAKPYSESYESSRADWNILYSYNPSAIAGGFYAPFYYNGKVYATAWNAVAAGNALGKIYRFNISGNTLTPDGDFTVAGLTPSPGADKCNIEGFCTDGTYIYGANEAGKIYKIDPTTWTLVSSIDVSNTLVAPIAYDKATGGFWVADMFATTAKLVTSTGADAGVTLTGATTGGGIMGLAYDDISEGGPYVLASVGTSNTTNVAQIGRWKVGVNNTFTIIHDVANDPPTTTGNSMGGMFNYEADGTFNLVVMRQSGPVIFGYEIEVLGERCDPASNLTATQNGANVNLSWSAAPGAPTGYEVLCDGALLTTTSATTTTYTHNNPNPGSRTYSVRALFAGDCIPLGVSTTITVQEVFEGGCVGAVVGTATTTTYNIPINTYWRHSYTQQIYLESELTEHIGKEITAIAYEYIKATTDLKNPVTVYIGYTTKSTFATTADWVPVAQLTEVFHGSLTLTNALPWFVINLNEPFFYEGGNLVVAVLNNHGSYDNSNPSFRFHTTTGNNRTLRYQVDGDVQINPVSPPTGTLSTERSNIRFTVCPGIGTYTVSRNGEVIAAGLQRTSFLDETFDAYEPHTWCVVLTCEEGESDAACVSMEACQQPGDCDAPANFTVTYAFDCTANLSWGEENAKSATIEIKPNEASKENFFKVKQGEIDTRIDPSANRLPGGGTSAPTHDGIDLRSYADAYVGDTYSATTGYKTMNLATGATTIVGTMASADEKYPTGEGFNGTTVYRLHNRGQVEIVGATGAVTTVGTIAGVVNSIGLAYDWITNDGTTWYFYDTPGSAAPYYPQLFKLNMSTLAKTLVGTSTINTFLRGLEMANDGNLYAMSTSLSALVRINPANGTFTNVGPLGFTPAYGQELAFDRVTNTLYSSTLADQGPFANPIPRFGTVNTATGAFSTIISYSGLHQHATFVIAKNNNPNLAKAPSNFTATPVGASKSCKLSWINPTQTTGDAPLASITSIVVQRNGATIATLSPAGVGAAMAYTDVVPVEGSYTYSVYAVTSEGNGQSASAGPVTIGAMCELFFEMWDEYGDGWNGNAAVTVLVNGVSAGTAKLASGSYGTTTLLVPGGDLQLSWTTGTFDCECMFNVYKNGELIYASPYYGEYPCNTPGVGMYGISGVFFTGELNCGGGGLYNIYRNNVLIAEEYEGTTFTDFNFDPTLPQTWCITAICPNTFESEPACVEMDACTPEPCDPMMQIGNGTTTSYYVPAINWNRHGYVQQIYDASEINSGGMLIKSISFQSTGAMDLTTQTIYLGNTTKSTFTSTTDWVPLAQLQEVYQGSISYTATTPGWFTITLQTPFTYTGGNLVLAYLNNHGTYYTAPTFWSHNPGAPKTLYYGTDTQGAVVNPASPPAGTIPTTPIRSNIQLETECPDLIDLAALTITGFPRPVATASYNYTVTIKNNGENIATNYEVKILTSNNIELASVANVEPIAPNQTMQYVLPVTFHEAGPVAIKGAVIMEGDQNPINNSTPLLQLEVKPYSEDDIINIPSDPWVGPTVNSMPYNFYWKNSMVQSVYLSSEMLLAGGFIKTLTWFYNATASITNEPIKAYLANAPAGVTSVSTAWYPLSNFTLVYEGVATIPTGLSKLTVELPEPFLYTGGSLIIMTERPMIQGDYTSGINAYTTVASPANRSRTYNSDSAPFNWTQAGSVSSSISNVEMAVKRVPSGVVQGRITTCGTTTPLAGVEVALSQYGLTATTNANGEYYFSFVPEGNYVVTATKFLYHDVSTTLTVTANQVHNVDLCMSLRPEYSVFGVVRAADGSFIEGASLRLQGYENYTATSGAYGIFEFPNVMISDYDYTLTVTATGFQAYTAAVPVIGNTNLGTITLLEVPYPPSNVQADYFGDFSKVTWVAPGDVTIFRYDNGIATGQLGFSGSFPRGVMGSCHRVAAELKEMSWFLTDQDGAAPAPTTVNIYLFSLDGAGMPTTNIIYSALNVPSTKMEFNTHVFPTPVQAPNGFYLSLSISTGFLALGTTTPDATYPFMPQTHFYNSDFNQWGFTAIENNAPPFLVNFMIRAEGILLGKSGSYTFANGKAMRNASKAEEGAALTYIPTAEPIVANDPNLRNDGSKGILGYKVWRLLQGQETNQGAWQILTNNPINALEFTDFQWTTLPMGTMYKYAVRTCYHGGVESNPAISNPLEKTKKVEYTINVATNSGDSPAGAILKLNNVNNPPASHTATVPETGIVHFDEVTVGAYELEVTLPLYHKYNATINITQEGATNVTLIEIIEEPYGLDIKEIEICEALFSWNNTFFTPFSDDVESYQDFIISNIGDYTLVDADGLSTYIWNDETVWPNMGVEMAYMVFNPHNTSPSILTIPQLAGGEPHSGNKYFAAFSSPYGAVNDWLILPKLPIVAGVKFSFWAKTINTQWGMDRIKVGVSTTGTTPSNFTIISTGNYISVPGTWTQYSFDLTNYAGQEVYLAINCISDDAFILMVDDIYVGFDKSTSELIKLPPKSNSKGFLGYSVYVDGNLWASGIQGTEYTFNNLPKGNRIIGVQANYSSGNSDIITIPFTSNCDVDPTYKVTFNVYDQAGDPITDATIEFNGEIIAGYVVQNVAPGKYPWTVSAQGVSKSDEVTVTNKDEVVDVQLEIGISEYEVGFGLYPNPATDKLTVKRTTTAPAIIQIYNAMGAHINKYETSEDTFEMNITTLPAGTYFIRVTEDDRTGVKSFVKK